MEMVKSGGYLFYRIHEDVDALVFGFIINFPLLVSSLRVHFTANFRNGCDQTAKIILKFTGFDNNPRNV